MRVKIFCKEMRLITYCVWVNRNRRYIIRGKFALIMDCRIPQQAVFFFLRRLLDALVAFPQATSSVATVRLLMK